MAKGNWKPEVIHPKVRCRYCGRVVKRADMDRIGVYPCHKECKAKFIEKYAPAEGDGK